MSRQKNTSYSTERQNRATGPRRARQSLKEREAQFRALFAGNPVATWIYDQETLRILEVNDRACEQFGFTREELLTMDLANLRDPDEMERLRAYLQTVTKDQLHTGIWRYRRKNGTYFDGEATALSVVFGGRRARIVAAVDVTERRREEEARRERELELERRVAERTADLAAVNVELQQATRLKNEFLANISHELRTPLNNVLGRCEVLLEDLYGPLSEPQQRAIRSIETSGRHLLALINDVLDISRIEAGAITLQLQQTEVRQVCTNSLQILSTAAAEKQIAIGLELDQAVVTLQVDERRLRQVLVNLLANAVKFTPVGGQVRLLVRGDHERQAVTFTVSDTGIGIAAADLPRLFQPFVQLDSGLTRQYEGTGLGLALVAKLVAMHGGSVAVASQPGVGSSFSVSVPWEPELAENEPDEPASQLPYVLVADESPVSANRIARILRLGGYRPLLTRSASEAAALAGAQQPAAMILGTGVDKEAARQLLAQRWQSDLTVIVLASLPSENGERQWLEAGATAYLAQPPAPGELLAALVKQAV